MNHTTKLLLVLLVTVVLVSLVEATEKAPKRRAPGGAKDPAAKKEPAKKAKKPKTKVKASSDEDSAAMSPELMHATAKCAACEKMIERVEADMRRTGTGETIASHRLDKNNKRATLHNAMKEARAIEILEKACSAKDEQEQAVRLFCENAVEELETELLEYIQRNEVDESFKEKACKNFCQWKHGLKQQVEAMQKGLKDRLPTPSVWEVLVEVLRDEWRMILASAGAAVVVGLVLGLCVLPRFLNRDVRKLKKRA
eukprot:TRINITY_DN44143_c0_g1_i1.p1 TRINITY_DN44143_c0_g1~~TRINITY_DN44143_c0_g1_i1.p1  ORF type:complete len:255 (-),score=65.62 TRINITY_DN44143_c0_g1_i1:36-800(-)